MSETIQPCDLYNILCHASRCDTLGFQRYYTIFLYVYVCVCVCIHVMQSNYNIVTRRLEKIRHSRRAYLIICRYIDENNINIAYGFDPETSRTTFVRRRAFFQSNFYHAIMTNGIRRLCVPARDPFTANFRRFSHSNAHTYTRRTCRSHKTDYRWHVILDIT